MKKISIKLIFLLHLIFPAFAQTPKINLDRPVNTPLSNERNPTISGDGKFMILETDYGDEKLYPVIARAVATMWTRPEEITGVFNKLTNDNGFNLNYDGSELYFSSSRYGGVGNADIWISQKSGDKWLPPQNLAKPVNSSGAEKDPSISPDGRRLYFVRLNGKKTKTGADCGTIMFSEPSGSMWKEPVALPAPVNSGCECAPKILADNKTLVFASERPGGKGGFDLYKTTLLENGKWSAPVSMDFINTEKDEIHAAVPAKGDYLFITGEANGKDDIFKVKVPENFRPFQYEYVESIAKAADNNKPLACKVVVTKANENKPTEEFYSKSTDGKIITVISGKEQHDITLFAVTRGYFWSGIKVSAGSTNPIPSEIKLVPLKTGASVEIKTISFSDKSEIVSGKEELDKLVKILQDNPSINVEIGVHMSMVTADTIQKPDLTELRIDSTYLTQIITREEKIPDTDSTFRSVTLTDTIKTLQIIKTYHNERTGKDAEAIKKYLMNKGIPESRFSAVGYSDKKKKLKADENKLVEIVVL